MAKKPTPKPSAPVTPKVDPKGIKAIEEFNKNIQESQKQQIQSQKSLNDIANELSDTWSGLASAIKEINGLSSKLGDNFDGVADLTKQIHRNIENVGSELYEELDITSKIKKINDDRGKQILQSKKLKTQINKLDSDTHDTEKALKKIQEERLKILKEQEDLSNTAVEFLASQSAERREQLATQLAESKAAEESLSTQLADLKATQEAAKLAKDTLATEIARGVAEKEALTALEQTSIVLDTANKKAKKLGISVDDIADNITKPFQDAVRFLDNVPGGDLISKAFGLDSIMDKVKSNVTKSFTESLAATGSVGKASFAALRAGAMSFMTSILPILPILLAVTAAAYAIKKAFDMDQEVTDMARGLGISKEEAAGVHSELLEIAEDTKVIGANSEALGAAYTELAKSMGVTKLANAEMAETQVLLTKQMGMASEDAANFQKMSMAGGKSAEQNMAVIKAGVDAMSGGLMNYKEVAGEIAKSSKAVQASYKGNIAALTKAVVTAKKFGMTLDDTKKAADSILDIESSLEKEMTANVLTGKNMNLNLARELALRGDSAGAMEEMMKQAGGYDEIMKMAPYQQKAVAEAMGLTTDEMIKGMETQKNMQSIAKDVGVALGENGKFTEKQLADAAALGNEEAKKLLIQEQQNSASEKLSALGDKLMVMFSKLAEPIMEMLDPLMEMVEVLFPAIKVALDYAFAPVKAIFTGIGGIVKIFKGDFLGGIHDIGAAIIGFVLRPFTAAYDLLVGFFPSIGKLVDKAMGWITDKLKGLLPDWALKLLGIGGDDKSKEASPAAESTETATKVNDAVIDPNGGLVVKGAAGEYQLNKNDSIVAGTNLTGGTPEESGGMLSGLGDLASSVASSVGSVVGAVTGNAGNGEMVSLLKELIAKVDQPVKLTIGSKAIDEIESQTSMKRSFTTKADRSYGTFA